MKIDRIKQLSFTILLAVSSFHATAQSFAAPMGQGFYNQYPSYPYTYQQPANRVSKPRPQPGKKEPVANRVSIPQQYRNDYRKWGRFYYPYPVRNNYPYAYQQNPVNYRSPQKNNRQALPPAFQKRLQSLQKPKPVQQPVYRYPVPYAYYWNNYPVAKRPVPTTIKNKSKHVVKHKPVLKKVMITDQGFRPSQIKISPGDKVLWANIDGVPHQVNSPNGWRSKLLTRGATFVHTFKEPGIYSYFARSNPKIGGKVLVK